MYPVQNSGIPVFSFGDSSWNVGTLQKSAGLVSQWNGVSSSSAHFPSTFLHCNVATFLPFSFYTTNHPTIGTTQLYNHYSQYTTGSKCLGIHVLRECSGLSQNYEPTREVMLMIDTNSSSCKTALLFSFVSYSIMAALNSSMRPRRLASNCA